MVAIFTALFKLLLDSRSNFPWVKPSKYKQKLKTMAEQGISYSGLEDLFLTYPKSESNISLKNKIEMLPTSQEHRKKLAQLLETLNSSYTKDHKAENNIKALWNNYKSDLCLLVQTLELWEDKKKKESYENS